MTAERDTVHDTGRDTGRDIGPGVFARIGRIGFVPVVTVDRPDQAIAVGTALLAGGLGCMEITFRTAAAEQAIAAVAEQLPELDVGAGTLMTVEHADAAAAAGAAFAVTPGFDGAVVDRCTELGLPIAPGVMTPSEINLALARQLRTLKFFPAEAAGGVAALRAVAAVYPDVTFLPTGGIDRGNLAEYLALPAVVACGGSWVTPTAAVDQGDVTEIERRAAEVVAVVAEARSTR